MHFPVLYPLVLFHLLNRKILPRDFPESEEKTKVKVADGNLVSTRGKVEPSFFLGGKNFTGFFLILPRMNHPNLGLSFF